MENKISALMATLTKMEQMKDSVISETNADINDLRWEKLQEINGYLTDVAKTLNGKSVSISLSRFGLDKYSSDSYYLCLNRVPRKNDDNTPVPWFIGDVGNCYILNGDYWECIDGNMPKEKYLKDYHKGTWDKVIRDWNEIKSYFEEELEKTIQGWIEETVTETAERISEYDSVSRKEV